MCSLTPLYARETVCFQQDYSKASNFLSFSILVPESDAWKMCEVYDRLAARGVITVRLWNKLTPKPGADIPEALFGVVLCIVLQVPVRSFCLCQRCTRPKEGLLWGVCHARPHELQAASYWPHLRSPPLLWCLWPRRVLGGRQKLNWSFRGAFYHLEQDLSWLCDWRELLRSQHHFLPGEENHYQGQVRDKADGLGRCPFGSGSQFATRGGTAR